MGYEYASYEEQIKALMAENRKAGNPAVTKRIHDDQKLVPVITAVLNWDEKEWSGPRHLHEMLKFPEELFDALKAVAGDERYEQIAEQLTKEEKEEGVRMCVVAEKLERIGIEKGRMEERANTEREKHRAMIAEQEVLELRRELERLKNSRS